jgi:hypothetical protein
MENLEKLIVDLKDSLERELTGLRHDVQQGIGQLNTRFDTQAARLERHAGLWQTGARWSSRMDAWAEKVDVALGGCLTDLGARNCKSPSEPHNQRSSAFIGGQIGHFRVV